MTLAAHTMKKATTSARSKKRVGRGNATGKGTYASRGLKGQRSRSGGKGGGQRRGFKQALQKVPKLRGFKSPHASSQAVTLATLERVADVGTVVTPFFLKQKNLIKSVKAPVKIVATGELKKKLTITGCLATKQSVVLIEKAGGTITF